MGAHNAIEDLVLDAARTPSGTDVDLSTLDLDVRSLESDILRSSGLGTPIGYTTGAGGAVTQASSKSTGVTLNASCGQITMNNASLAAATTVSFTFTCSAIGATDMVHVQIASGGTAFAYRIWVDSVAAGSCVIALTNNTGAGLAEALVLNFAVINVVTS